MLSVFLGPKVIPLSSAKCAYQQKVLNIAVSVPFQWHDCLRIRIPRVSLPTQHFPDERPPLSDHLLLVHQVEALQKPKLFSGFR